MTRNRRAPFTRAFIAPETVRKETERTAAGLRRVVPTAGSAIRTAIATLGRNIQREEHYDFPLIARPEKDPVYLWLDRQPCCGEYEVTGAAVFSLDFYSNLPGVWCLVWIWLQPFARRCGRLTKAWPVFSKRHYPFTVQPLVSLRLTQFLTRYPHETGLANAPLYSDKPRRQVTERLHWGDIIRPTKPIAGWQGPGTVVRSCYGVVTFTRADNGELMAVERRNVVRAEPKEGAK